MDCTNARKIQGVKQLNIFGEIDNINENGEVMRCEICNKGISKGTVCSDECAKEWIDKNFPKIDKDER